MVKWWGLVTVSFPLFLNHTPNLSLPCRDAAG